MPCHYIIHCGCNVHWTPRNNGPIWGARSNITLLSTPTQLGGDMGMVTIHLSAWLSIQGFWPLPMNYSMLGCLGPILALIWPQKFMKMAEIYGFQLLPRKIVARSSSNLECTLVWWASRIYSLLECTGPISAICCQKLTENGVFLPLSRKLITQSTSSWCNFTYWVSVYFHFGSCLPNFIPLVSKEKWLRI